jgi:MoaA/NifB/PqqE/SkfB family radical SAM enzyme
MNLPHDKFCVLPWVSLEASPIGTVRPCCLADDEIVDNNGKKFELYTACFNDIQNSNYMRDLRRQFLEGKKPQTCRKCWNEERSGRTSKRMHTLNRLKHVLPNSDWTTDAKPLMFLDLKLGNICNLKCRICGSWSSSQFAAEELADMNPAGDKKKTFPYQMLRAGAWPKENEIFWNEIGLVSDQIRYIEFTGGEPFMIQEHFRLLERIVERGIAGQIEIHYNTNGTQFPEEAEDIWQHFKTVEIAFSIDDVAERFEYQRSNAVWSEVEYNIARFEAMRDRHANIQLQVCCTVNIFNVYYLEHVAKWIADRSFDFVYWNMMHDAWYFSIATLPDSVKQAVTQNLMSADIPAKFLSEIERIIEFMNRGASTDGNMLLIKIRDLDRKRQQNMRTVLPEFAALLDYDYNQPDSNIS